MPAAAFELTLKADGEPGMAVGRLLLAALRLSSESVKSCAPRIADWQLFACVSAEEELSFRELQEQLRMPKEDLVRVLHSLACAKYKVRPPPCRPQKWPGSWRSPWTACRHRFSSKAGALQLS